MQLTLEIADPHVDSDRKLKTALEILEKAFPGIEVDHDEVEQTPYQSLIDITEESFNDVSDALYQIWRSICKEWLHTELDKAKSTDPYKLKGRVFINPKTGKRLTRGEWETIKRDLTRLFGKLYRGKQKQLVMKALALGKILNSMDPAIATDKPANALEIEKVMRTVERSAVYSNMIQFAEVHTGELIQDVTTRSRRAIMQTILQGYQDGTGQRELARKLFDQFSVLNRDWRRIAETENAINFNNGYLLAELEAAPKGEDVFVKGISGAGACPFCRSNLDNQTFVLREKAPGGDDQVTIDKETYTAIWPGKNNFGRKRDEWWACFPSHPHCRCSTIRINPMFEAILREKMKS